MLCLALEACGNLACLKCHGKSSGLWTWSRSRISLPDRPLKLTHLQFEWDPSNALTVLRSILSRSPSLKYFATASESFDIEELQEVPAMVQQYCPLLIQFHMMKSKDLFKNPGLCYIDTGIQHVVSLADMRLAKGELAPLFSHYSPNLDALRMDLTLTVQALDVWNSVAFVGQFQRLSEIDFRETDLENVESYLTTNDYYSRTRSKIPNDQDLVLNSQVIASIIRKSSCLKVVRLSGFYLDDQVFSALGDLRNLRRLDLLECRGVKAESMHRL